ncbi:hypothetical protein SCHPADRAFT_245500 [Schizopora paradoxa]|uniref:Uncharacterized protein n=1 Tax=Schizopora paradoxa TaxID=27342 RepID=A0A0H2RVF4_9AGAM|nr:hypothetical protein SCHPADRAFT_245500 [Schizopora paradoxa]
MPCFSCAIFSRNSETAFQTAYYADAVLLAKPRSLSNLAVLSYSQLHDVLESFTKSARVALHHYASIHHAFAPSLYCVDQYAPETKQAISSCLKSFLFRFFSFFVIRLRIYLLILISILLVFSRSFYSDAPSYIPSSLRYFCGSSIHLSSPHSQRCQSRADLILS